MTVLLLQTTMLFDIGLPGESDGYIVFHHPVLSPLPIKPFKLHIPGWNYETDPLLV